MDQTQARAALVPEQEREAFLKLEEQARSVLIQIEGLQAALARIRVQQNAFLPALRVPDDVLLSIFSHALDREDALSYAQDLLLITSVCIRWRALAKTVPGLWTSILVAKPQLASLFLSRSGSALLSVYCARYNADSTRPKQLMALVGPNLDRIRNLRIEMRTPDLYKTWMDHLAALPAPALRQLSLGMDNNRFAIGLPIFANETPSLHSLSLKCIVYPATSPLFSNLRHLSLHGIFTPEGYQFQPFLEILSRSPALETLVLLLVYALEEQYRGLPPGTTPVLLSRLRSLRMVAMQPCALRVIPHLSLPDDTTLHITVGTSAFPAKDGPILDHPLVLQGITSVRYVLEGARHSASYTILSAYREEHPAEFPKPVLFLKVEDDTPQVSAVLDTLDLRSVVRFEVDVTVIARERDEAYWYTVLKRLPALRTLIIDTHWHMTGMLTVLITPVRDDGDQASSYICPALEHLELRDAACGERFWPTLENLVTARRNSGSTLKSISLSIAYGRVDERAMCAIRERVGTVTVRR